MTIKKTLQNYHAAFIINSTITYSNMHQLSNTCTNNFKKVVFWYTVMCGIVRYYVQVWLFYVVICILKVVSMFCVSSVCSA